MYFKPWWTQKDRLTNLENYILILFFLSYAQHVTFYSNLKLWGFSNKIQWINSNKTKSYECRDLNSCLGLVFMHIVVLQNFVLKFEQIRIEYSLTNKITTSDCRSLINIYKNKFLNCYSTGVKCIASHRCFNTNGQTCKFRFFLITGLLVSGRFHVKSCRNKQLMMPVMFQISSFELNKVLNVKTCWKLSFNSAVAVLTSAKRFKQ